MKYIKRKSTNKIVHREVPHTDHTINNASVMLGIDKSDLEIVEEELTDDQWNAKQFADTSYTHRRKTGYGDLREQLDMQYWDKKNGTDNWEKHIDKVKSDHPKDN